jgi:hypothetical protein
MRQESVFAAVMAAAVASATAMGGSSITQLNYFRTGFDNNGVPRLIPAIDPASVAYHAPSGHLFIADSEIEEVPAAFSLVNANVFETSRSGDALYGSYNLTLLGNEEPTGITFNPFDGFFYTCDDDDRRVTRYAFSPGSGFSVNDSVSTSSSAGSSDPEGITCNPATGRIYVVDGAGEFIVVYRYQGSDFIVEDILDLNSINGAANTPDDPEGIAYDACSGHLFLVSDPEERIYEFTLAGDFVVRYDISTLSPDPIAPQGLTLGPTSANNDDPAAMAIYIADGGIDNNQNSSERDGVIYEIASPCGSGPPPPPPPITDCNENGVDDSIDISSGTSQDCNGNGVPDECEGGDPCAPGTTLLLSFTSSTTLPGVGTVANEDIVAYDTGSGIWSMYFDGSDVGVGSFTIDAMAVLPGGDLLISFTSAGTVAGIAADDSDILRFTPASLGPNTAGTWSMYFDGSDVELTSSSEDVDAVDVLPDGTLIISTTGSPGVTGVSSPRDEDLLAFSPTSLGDLTAGTWSHYFDGSDVGLADSSSEDVDAVSISPEGFISLSTTGNFSVAGVSGFDEDVFDFSPTTLGPTTAGSYSPFFIGIAEGVPSDADVGSVEELP